MANLVDEIAIKLGVPLTELNTALNQAGAKITSFSKKGSEDVGAFGKLWDKLSDKVVGMRDLSSAVATALGLNLTNIGNQLARMIVGLSAAEEEAYKKIGELSDRATEMSLKNMRARLTDEQRLQQLYIERDKIIRDLSFTEGESGRTQLHIKQQELALQTALKEINEIEAKQAQAAQKAAEERNRLFEDYMLKSKQQSRDEFEAKLSIMGVEEKIDALLEQIEVKEAAIATHAMSAKGEEEARTYVLKLRNDLLKAQFVLAKENLENEKQSSALEQKSEELRRASLPVREQIKALRKDEATLLFLMSGYEEGSKNHNEATNALLETRTKIRALEATQAEANKEIAGLLLKGEENLTEEESERLKLLTGQTTKLQQQAEIQMLLDKGVANLTETEKKRLAVLTGQTDQLKTQKVVVDSFIAAWKGFSMSLGNKGDIRNLSDTQLSTLANKLQRQLADVSLQGQQNPFYDAEFDPMAQSTRLNLEDVKKEIALRAGFQSTVSKFGQNYAEAAYAPDDFSRLLQYLDPDQAKQQAADTATIATVLKNVFPKAASNTRGGT
jgi:hypothetical protein